MREVEAYVWPGSPSAAEKGAVGACRGQNHLQDKGSEGAGKTGSWH